MVRLFTLVLSVVCVMGTQISCAQTAKQPQTADGVHNAQAEKRQGRPIKHIYHEDASNTIEEVREGADTKSIVVKPNNRMPSYDIVPASRHGVPTHRSTPQQGRRMWRLMNF